MGDIDSIRGKNWVAEVDDVRQPNEEYEHDLVEWTGPYIAHPQIQSAFDDPDVTVCDIEADDDEPIVYLQLLDGANADWPTTSHRQLVSMATQRFRQHDDQPGWDAESPRTMLKNARLNLDRAQFALEKKGDTLEAEEEMGDALNYTLFALDLLAEETNG